MKQQGMLIHIENFLFRICKTLIEIIEKRLVRSVKVEVGEKQKI